MQPIEIALFAVVAVLALALIGAVVRPTLRTRPPAPDRAEGGAAREPLQATPGQPMVCPACHREYAPGLQFCPHDARDLIPANDPAARRASAGATCPSCKRSYDAGKRFCSFDGEGLVPLTLAIGAGDASAHLPGILGKICPNCSHRYEGEATFCARDGEALVIVN
jgi:hypothetical protein